MKRSLLTMAGLVCLISFANAQHRVDNEHCAAGTPHSSLRQTAVVIDGSIIASDDEEGPSAENQEWRRFASAFVDAGNPLIGQLIAPRERVTIVIANADGSGLTPIFTGCVPLLSEEESKVLDSETGTLQTFFGRDWRSLNEKAATAFARSARVAMIRGTAEAVIGPVSGKKSFAQGPLVASLRNSPGFDLSDGLVRYVIPSDLGLYDFQSTDVATARAKGFEDAEKASLRLARSEIHFFADGTGGAASTGEYLDAFFLGSEAKLETLGSSSSTLASNNIPVTVAVFQGTADFPNIGDVPVRMRLVLDRNNSVVMSWFQEQRRLAQNVPLEGVLTCSAGDECSYSGDDVFAQAWTIRPGGVPECEGKMPWGGMRNLNFTQSGGAIVGTVSDTLCFIRGREETGIPFTLVRLESGLW